MLLLFKIPQNLVVDFNKIEVGITITIKENMIVCNFHMRFASNLEYCCGGHYYVLPLLHIRKTAAF